MGEKHFLQDRIRKSVLSMPLKEKGRSIMSRGKVGIKSMLPFFFGWVGIEHANYDNYSFT